MKQDPTQRIKMSIIPYGCGWEDVYLNIGNIELYFSLSTVEGSSTQQLLRLLYYLHPRQNDPLHADDLCYYYGIREKKDGILQIGKIVDRLSDEPLPYGFEEIPYKGSFQWNEEGAKSLWTLIRPPTYETDFLLTLQITLLREHTLHYTFQIPYKALCYEVAKAFTKMIQTHGLLGYHRAVYEWDMNLRHLLFIKAYALDRLEDIAYFQKEDRSCAATDFEKELRLLLLDMD